MSRVLLLMSLLVAAASSVRGQEGASRVTCTVPGDAEARTWVLEQASGHWQITFTSRTATRPVRLALPGARPVLSAASATLSYKNANGGRQVELKADEANATLDVWVDHGLEVNIEPDLDPRVDLMNTHGALEGVRCTVARM
jgi:hypothetical protein